MKDYMDELLSQLEAEHPDIFNELHGWSARRQYGDLRLQLVRQDKFILKHMPTIMAHVPEHRVLNIETIGDMRDQVPVPVIFVSEKIIYHCKGYSDHG